MTAVKRPNDSDLPDDARWHAVSPSFDLKAVQSTVAQILGDDGDGLGESDSVARERTEAPAPRRLPRLADILDATIVRAVRRHEGTEKPVSLPWPSLDAHFGGGLWPGVHFLSSTTGIGKTQLALQIARHANRHGIPAAYVGLELEAYQIGCRVLAGEARVPWAHAYTGKLGAVYLERFKSAASGVGDPPFHPFFGEPQGWPASKLSGIGEQLRAEYPEADGPGSRPLLLVLDFLQIVGPEVGERADLRERIARAAYECRALAARLNLVVLVVSSVARDKYAILGKAQDELSYDLDDDGRPINRHLPNPDALVGLGKESGEIEYSGDSVSVVFRAGPTTEHGTPMVFATAKGRASAATWSPLRFTGFAYAEPEDGGALMVDGWKTRAEERDAKRVGKREAKQRDKEARILRDAVAVARYVLEHPGGTVRGARVNVVGDSSDRWAAATAKLGDALDRASGLTVDRERLSAEVLACLA